MMLSWLKRNRETIAGGVMFAVFMFTLLWVGNFLLAIVAVTMGAVIPQ